MAWNTDKVATSVGVVSSVNILYLVPGITGHSRAKLSFEQVNQTQREDNSLIPFFDLVFALHLLLPQYTA